MRSTRNQNAKIGVGLMLGAGIFVTIGATEITDLSRATSTEQRLRAIREAVSAGRLTLMAPNGQILLTDGPEKPFADGG